MKLSERIRLLGRGTTGGTILNARRYADEVAKLEAVVEAARRISDGLPDVYEPRPSWLWGELADALEDTCKD